MKETPEKVWPIVSIVALVLLAAVLGFNYLVPKPVETTTALDKHKKDVQKIRKEMETDKTQLVSAKIGVAEYAWSVSPETIFSTALKTVTAITKNHKVDLVAFRPQRVTEDKGLVNVPSAIIVSGPYPAIVAVLKDIETSSNKLAVNAVQVASADTATSKVTATIGVTAFTFPAKIPPKTPIIQKKS